MGDSKEPRKPYTIEIRLPIDSQTQSSQKALRELFCIVECSEERNDLMAGEELWFKIDNNNLQAVRGIEHIGNVLSPEKELLIKFINDGHRLLGIINEVKQTFKQPTKLSVLVENL